MSTPTATPRTDECLNGSAHGNAIEYLARTLETELAAAQAECNRLYESSPTALDALTAELSRLRADLERFTGHGLLDCHAICDQRDAAVAERDRLRAELKELSQAYELNRVSIDELDADRARAEKAEAEVERLLIIEQQFKQSPMWDTLAIVQTRNNWKDRAARAEAALQKIRDVMRQDSNGKDPMDAVEDIMHAAASETPARSE